MIMKKKWITAMVVVMTLAMLAGSAMAMPVNIIDGTVTLTGVKVNDNQAVKTDLQSFQLLGYDAEGNYLIFASPSYYSIDPQRLSGIVSQIDPGVFRELPRFAGMEELARGAKGDAVIRLQESLKAAGYLQGNADGDYGGGTEKAIRAMQAECGLEETGVADALTQLLALSMGQEEVQVSATGDATDFFEAISDRANIDTQVLLDSGLSLNYDDMTGIGFMSDGIVLTYDASGEADIDLYQLSLQFGLSVCDSASGTVDIQPAVTVSCRCVRRPVLTEIILKSGNMRGTAEITDLDVTLDGSYSLEKGTAILNEQMVAALANAKDSGELKLRVNGRYNSFDISADPAFLASLANLADVIQNLQK